LILIQSELPCLFSIATRHRTKLSGARDLVRLLLYENAIKINATVVFIDKKITKKNQIYINFPATKTG